MRNSVLRALYPRVGGDGAAPSSPTPMTLKPTEFEDGDPLCPHCVVAKLTPMAGRSFGSKATFLWWRCEVCGGITEAVALPRGRRIRI